MMHPFIFEQWFHNPAIYTHMRNDIFTAEFYGKTFYNEAK